MNYLAHLFLSNKDPKLMMGNFLGDLITNKDFHQLEPELKKGVELHRLIDTYTDNHKIVSKTVEYLHPHHHKYAPVVVDIFYDYLLFINWKKYTDESVQDFADWSYEVINEYLEFVPQRRRKQVESMVSHNWLLGYGEFKHLHQTFLRVKKRARFPSNFELATQHLVDNLEILNSDFNEFFPDLIETTQEFISKK